MARSTKADKARLLIAAHRLLEHNTELSEAAQTLSREFDLSLRQAYRYLEQAAELGHPVPVEEASIPITLKLPPSTVRLLRSYAASTTGLTLGEIVARALGAFLSALRRHG
jgi:predicted DNA-binding transcriptional regulator YafY